MAKAVWTSNLNVKCDCGNGITLSGAESSDEAVKIVRDRGWILDASETMELTAVCPGCVRILNEPKER